MNLTVGNDLALAFVLLFARSGGVMNALPMLLGCRRFRFAFGCCSPP